MFAKPYNSAANLKPYERVIEDLLDLQGLRSSDEWLTEARRMYLETAIERGFPLSPFPDIVSNLSRPDLENLRRKIPDKQAKGWHGVTSFSVEDRKAFSEWAQVRKDGIWNNLLPQPETTDTMIFFSGQDADTTETLLEEYIEAYNAKAKEAYEQSLLEDENRLKDDSSAFPQAGRTIDQRKIRLDPDNSKLTQSFDPKKEKWVSGPKVGKFLQDTYQWKLFDILQQSDEALSNAPNSNRKELPSFVELMNRNNIDCDPLLEAEQLRILISSDPQKIAEMSTGQRWSSCMSRDGMNYSYVEHDIRQGSLVAYVVHKNDVEGRYPLMRQLIKPYKSNNGDLIFVPAKVYGGEGSNSAKTIASLRQSLVGFVGEHNSQAAFDNYSMVSTLYADGQATFVNLRENWQDDQINIALEDFQDGAIEEWMTELVFNSDRKIGRYGEDASATAKKYLRKLENVLQNDDPLIGLPRIFYREQIRSTVGVNANPEDIERVAEENSKLRVRREIFQALKSGDLDEFSSNEKAIKEEEFNYDEEKMLNKIVAIAVLSAKPTEAISTSIDVLKKLSSYVKGGGDEYGSLDYSYLEKRIFSHIMDCVIYQSDKLTEEQIRYFAEFATNSLMYTTGEQRRFAIVRSDSWMGGGCEIGTDFEPSASEEVFAEKWIAMMELLRKHNPDLATEYASKVNNQYPEKLGYTSQHKYARRVLCGSIIRRFTNSVKRLGQAITHRIEVGAEPEELPQYDIGFNVEVQTGSLNDIAKSLGVSLSVFRANHTDESSDRLTGLYKRSSLINLLGKKAAVLDGEDESKFKLICIDIDHFKRVNDVHGHYIGDVVLQEVSSRINGLFKGDEQTLIGRIDGDEIAIVTSSNKIDKDHVERTLSGINPVLLQKSRNEHKSEIRALAA